MTGSLGSLLVAFGYDAGYLAGVAALAVFCVLVARAGWDFSLSELRRRRR